VPASPWCPGGVTLRFAQVKGYRHDKTPDKADSIDSIQGIFAGS